MRDAVMISRITFWRSYHLACTTVGPGTGPVNEQSRNCDAPYSCSARIVRSHGSAEVVAHADSRTIGQFPRYRISCESYSETMTLLLFGGPSPSLANRFGLRRSQLLFHFGCCTLKTFATETTGKLASVICVDVGVVLSPRNGYVREAVVARFSRCPRGSARFEVCPSAVAGHCAAIVKGTGARKTDSQSVGFSLNGTHLDLAKLHVAHSKDENRP